MKRDMNGQVADYRGLVESLAPRFVGRNQAEFDDLVQEGLIFVWGSLTKGIRPSAALIEARMQNWADFLGTQIGRGRGKSGTAVEYAQFMPIELAVGADEAGNDMALVDMLHAGNAIDPRLDPIPLPGHDPLG